ncbi:MAG: hypothetical protein ACJA1I_000542 [Zhongshania marina]|jgi:hypothetical protein
MTSTQTAQQAVSADLEHPQKSLPAEAQKRSLRATSVEPSSLIAIALEQGADIDKLTKLFELQTQWEASQARKAFNESLAAFKSNPPTISKNKHVYYESKDKSKAPTDYWHATLDQLVSAITPAMSEHGLGFRWHTNQREGMIQVSCILSHKLGHQETVSLFAHPDQSGGKNAIQAVGSTITYLQRYTLFSITGLAAGEDTDGVATYDQNSEPAQNEGGLLLSENQIQEIENRLKSLNVSVQSLSKVTGLPSIHKIPANAYNRVMAYLDRQEDARHAN